MSDQELSPTHVLFSLIGAALHLVIGVFVFASTLVAPLYAVVALGTVWLVAALWAWRRWRRSMFAPLLASIAVAVLWIGVLTCGEAVLDWTA